MAVVVNTVRVALSGAIPAGSNVIGGVTQSGSWSVSVTGTPTVTVSNSTIAVTQSGTWNIGSIATLPSLPSGSNVIGGVTQSGTWNVGISGTPTVTVGNASIPVTDNGGSLTVDGTVSVGTSVTPGTGATDLGKAEDAPFASGDTGVAMWAVRNDAAATALTSANADYSPIAVDSYGRQFVTGSVSVGGTVNVSAADKTAKVRSDELQTVNTYRRISTATTNSALAASSSGYQVRLHGYYMSNTSSFVRYVKLYDVISAPSVGSNTPVMTIAIPGNGAANVGFPFGPTFSNGLGIGITTGSSDSDTGTPGAGEVIVHLFYEQL